MPHPERANYARQVPDFSGFFEDGEKPGPGRLIFDSMKRYIQGIYSGGKK
jgi:hypothetical protein